MHLPIYPGSGKAALINANQQQFFFSNESVAGLTGTSPASVAFLLERQKAAAYPFGFAVEIAFSGVPGAFEVDVQAAEQDQDISYIQLGTGITAVNTGNAARFDGTPNLYYPKFVRLLIKTKTANAVNITAILTR